MTPLAHIAALPVKAYRLVFSPWVGFNCRYQPTCSAYALEALETHGGIKGSYLAARRIARSCSQGRLVQLFECDRYRSNIDTVFLHVSNVEQTIIAQLPHPIVKTHPQRPIWHRQIN